MLLTLVQTVTLLTFLHSVIFRIQPFQWTSSYLSNTQMCLKIVVVVVVCVGVCVGGGGKITQIRQLTFTLAVLETLHASHTLT